jgi:hypothetical protein
MAVFDLSGFPVNNHHPGIFSFLGGVLCYQVKGKVESELG